MTDPSQTDIPAGLLSGRLEGISLPDLVWALCRRNKTGVLTVSHAIRRTVYFEQGRIVFAVSDDTEDRLGETFLRDGAITLDDLDRALAELHTGKRIGTLLVEGGSLSASELVRGVLGQVQAIVLDLFTWDEGEYRFEEGPLPTDEVIKLGMKTSELVLRGIRRIRSFGRIRRSVGPPRTVYGLAASWKQALEGIDLSEGEELLIARLEQSDESVEWLCREVFLSNFEIYQTLWGFKVLGVVQEREARIERTREAAYEGSFEQHSFADVLVRLCRTGESGVLYVTRGARERTFHIDRDRCLFATSNDIDDGLVNYLLQRGVISLRDREETAKRLLSNKRVGTILRELGVIDDSDLRIMVREQLSQIVFDTFRWEAGEYAFVPGALPSNEEITLDESIESLVGDGMRRVRAWSRVRDGCGDLQSRLVLTPGFLEVLDRMGAGPEEWQVVTALKMGNTPREVCRTSELDDFRVCQILWALRVLGAVAPATDEVVETAEPTAFASPVEAGPPVKVDVEELDRPPADEPQPVVAAQPAPIATPAKAEPVEQEESEEAPEPVEPAPALEPVEAVESSEPVGPTAAWEPVEAAESSEPVEAVEPPEPESWRESPDAVEPLEVGRAGESIPVEEVGEPSVPETEIHVGVDESFSEEIESPATFEPTEVEEPASMADDFPVESADPRADDKPEAEDDSVPYAIPISVSADETQPVAVEAAEAATVYADAGDVVEGKADEPTARVDDRRPETDPVAPLDERCPERPEVLEVDHEIADGDDRAAGVEEDEPFVVVAEPSDEAPSPDATQTIPAEIVNAAISGLPPEAAVEDEPQAHEAASVEAEPSPDDEATRTVRLSRDQVEAALRGKPDPAYEPEASESAEPPDEPQESWEPPDDLEVSIARFNAVQRLLYRAVRAEVGAGASNFIRACCGQLGGESVDPLASAELLADGSWDEDGLRRAVVEHRIEEPWVEYQRLIDREVGVLRDHIGEAKAAELERQIERIDRASASG